ncbi:uncharacterized protein [Palaemon carinicauda]|uniref:uncharacterized protein n=1 Tax=Palaemon carinicauda TaxID=392227 RepID=UPI0035B5B9F5
MRFLIPRGYCYFLPTPQTHDKTFDTFRSFSMPSDSDARSGSSDSRKKKGSSPLPPPDLKGSKAALKRVHAYREKEKSRKLAELDRLCAAAENAHAGLRLYMLITTPSATTPSPPPAKVVPLLSDRDVWLQNKW